MRLKNIISVLLTFNIDMPNTVKISKNYSQLRLTTCFGTTFTVHDFIKSSVTF